MTDKIHKLKTFYNNLGSNTRLIIRTWLIATFWAVIMAIIAHNTHNYNLTLLSDDLIITARSIFVIGGICTIIAVKSDFKVKN